jgi:membrane fusion protein
MNAQQEASRTSRLFRVEVLQARQRGDLGEIFLARQSSHWLWTFLCVVMGAVVILFLAFGEYTRKERVTGQLALSHQSIKQYAPAVGTVVQRYVEEGATILRGEPLYRIYVDRIIQDKGDAQAAILRQIDSRRTRLQSEQVLLQRILREDESTLRLRSNSQQQQIQQLDREIDSQSKRVALNSENVARARHLAEKDIISAVELQDKEQENLTLRAQLDALHRSRFALSQELAANEAELRNAPLKARNQLSAIERSINELEQQAVDTESRRELTIVALTDGTVTGVLSDVGHQVSPTTPLLSILPKGATLVAQLNVPTRAIGFLQSGGRVALRYQAFPYQKFGQYSGTIMSIARTTFSPSDLQLVGDAKEQFYRVLVSLEEQQVLAYGKRMPLHDGMQLEADLRVDTRRLYEWILEPLYSLSGKY